MPLFLFSELSPPDPGANRSPGQRRHPRVSGGAPGLHPACFPRQPSSLQTWALRIRILWLGVALAGCVAVTGIPGGWVGFAPGGLLPSVAWAQEGEAKALPYPVAPEIMEMLKDDLAARWAGLDVLRSDFSTARAGLLNALNQETPLPGRWRLVHRLTEFGETEDIPILLALMEGNEDRWERKIITGSTRALYEPHGGVGDLSTVVQEFSFVQTQSLRRLPDRQEGLWKFSPWSLMQLHRSDIPYDVVKKLYPLRRKGFKDRDSLEKAMGKPLRRNEWKQYGEALVSMVERVPERVGLAGLARVGLQNPLKRPLLLQVGIGAWFGHLAHKPEPRLVYLEPGGVGSVDIPIEPVGTLDNATIRLDLRLREVNGPSIPAFSKVYLPLQP